MALVAEELRIGTGRVMREVAGAEGEAVEEVPIARGANRNVGDDGEGLVRGQRGPPGDVDHTLRSAEELPDGGETIGEGPDARRRIAAERAVPWRPRRGRVVEMRDREQESHGGRHLDSRAMILKAYSDQGRSASRR